MDRTLGVNNLSDQRQSGTEVTQPRRGKYTPLGATVMCFREQLWRRCLLQSDARLEPANQLLHRHMLGCHVPP